MNDFDLGRAMHTAVADPPTTEIIDLGLAVVHGRQRIRRRRIAAGVTAAVLAAALPIGAVVALTPGGAPQPAPGQQSTVASSAPPVAAPQRFDPLRLRLRSGWVPQDTPDRRQEAGLTSQTLGYAKFPESGGDLLHGLTATVYAAGATPNQHESVQPAGPGPSIGGQPSTWYGRASLMWQWAPTAWAVVTATGFGSVDANRAVAARFAAALRTDGDEAVRMSFTMARPPQPLRLIRTHLSWSPQYGPEGQLIFSDRDDETDPTTGFPRLLTVAVRRTEGAERANQTKPANTTLDGYPATVDFGRDGGQVTMADVRGHRQTVQVYDEATAQHVDRAKAIALCKGIRGIADPKQWTTTPLS